MEPGKENIVDIMQAFIDSRLFDLHTSIPGIFESYNPDTQLAEVTPTVRLSRKVNGTIIKVEIPTIKNVPVVMGDSSSFRIKYPIKKGDGCAVFFSEVGIGNYLNSNGNVQDPDDLARHSLTDAFCIPGLTAKSRVNKIATIELNENNELILLETSALFSTSKIDLLGATSSFVKGETLKTALDNFMNSVSVITPGDVSANAAALTVIKNAAITALIELANILSLKIKGE